MVETLFIDKKKISQKESLYDFFYNKGIELLQKYCGAVWTDYNIHDPGITILEQLCYALTELYHKSTFPVEDYFSGKDNDIPFEYLGLFEPEKIIPNGCITVNDFRKVLFDEVDEVGNVWLEYDPDDISGLYTIYVDIADQILLDDTVKNVVIRKVRTAFAKWRNLGEDAAKVVILEREWCELFGEIEIYSKRPIDELYGEIYAVCSQYVASNMFYRSIKELQVAGMQMFEILDGPLLKGGIILDNDLTERSRMISIPEMVAQIRLIDGVVDVGYLYLKTDTLQINDGIVYSEGFTAKAIKIPESKETIHLKLKSRSGHSFTVDYREIIDEVTKRLVCDALYPDYIDDIKKLYSYPKGTYQEFNNYYSIQNHFPGIYGISREGLSGREAPERKAKAKQLKAYLYFFEQIMADYVESIQNIKTLFSTDAALNQTYFLNYLNNSNIPDIEELYIDKASAEANLKKTLSGYDHFTIRRSGILDFMLGIYGLQLDQISLRNFLEDDSKHTVSQKIILNKIRYLKYASKVTLRLSKGINYLGDLSNPDHMAGLKLQTQLRIGNDPEKSDTDEAMVVIEHILLRPFTRTLEKKAQWFYNSRVSVVFPAFQGRYKSNQFKTLVMQIIEKSVPAHLFMDYIWCDNSQWNEITRVYSLWIKSFSDNDKLHDRLSVLLSKLIVKYRKQS
jgi:hypothetical protein